jgi:hypothetical protein
MAIRIDMRPDVVLVPEGDYLVEVDEVSLENSRQGSQYLSLLLQIVEGQHEGRNLWAIGSLRPEMLHLLRQTFVALGIDDEEVTIEVEVERRSGRPHVVVTEPDFVGRRAIASVVHDEWEGELRPKVRRLRPAE